MATARKRVKCHGTGRKMRKTPHGHYCIVCSKKFPKTKTVAPSHYQA